MVVITMFPVESVVLVAMFQTLWKVLLKTSGHASKDFALSINLLFSTREGIMSNFVRPPRRPAVLKMMIFADSKALKGKNKWRLGVTMFCDFSLNRRVQRLCYCFVSRELKSFDLLHFTVILPSVSIDRIP